MPRRPILTREAQHELAEQFVRCKGPIRHRWDLVVSSPDQRPTFGTLALFRCDNCTTERHDIISRVSGDLLARWYVYPEGYRDTPRHDAAWWRQLWAEQEWQTGKLLDSDVATRKPRPGEKGKRAAMAPAKVTPIRRRRAS